MGMKIELSDSNEKRHKKLFFGDPEWETNEEFMKEDDSFKKRINFVNEFIDKAREIAIETHTRVMKDLFREFYGEILMMYYKELRL